MMLTCYVTAPVNGRYVFVDDEDDVEFACDTGAPHVDVAPYEAVTEFAEKFRKRQAILAAQVKARAVRAAERDAAAAAARDRIEKERARYARFKQWVLPQLDSAVELGQEVTLAYAVKWLEATDVKLLMARLHDAGCYPLYWDDTHNAPVYRVSTFLYWYYKHEAKIEGETQ